MTSQRRLVKSWAHNINGPSDLVALGAATTITDLLSVWRTAFGLQTGKMTIQRIVGNLHTWFVTPGADALVVNGFVIGSIAGLTAANAPDPAGATGNDFTDWLWWDMTSVVNGVTLGDSRVAIDARAQRKFDPSRETLWRVRTITAAITSGQAHQSLGTRVLLGQ